jgi:hypothetical protein
MIDTVIASEATTLDRFVASRLAMTIIETYRFGPAARSRPSFA